MKKLALLLITLLVVVSMGCTDEGDTSVSTPSVSYNLLTPSPTVDAIPPSPTVSASTTTPANATGGETSVPSPTIPSLATDDHVPATPQGPTTATVEVVSPPATTKDSNVDHGYLEGGKEFEYGVRYDTGESYDCCGRSPAQARAVYLSEAVSQSSKWGIQKAYLFELVDTHDKIDLIMDSEFGDRLNLTPSQTYDLTMQIYHGWPSVYGLIIKKDTALVFQGYTAWDVEWEEMAAFRDFSPIQMRKASILSDHYKTDYPCYKKISNTEITFTLHEDSVTLRQGQTAVLGGFNISLQIAISVDYTNECLDAGQNQCSVVISAIRS